MDHGGGFGRSWGGMTVMSVPKRHGRKKGGFWAVWGCLSIRQHEKPILIPPGSPRWLYRPFCSGVKLNIMRGTFHLRHLLDSMNILFAMKKKQSRVVEYQYVNVVIVCLHCANKRLLLASNRSCLIH